MQSAAHIFSKTPHPEMARILDRLEAENQQPAVIDPQDMTKARADFVGRNQRWNVPMPKTVSVRQTALATRGRDIPLSILEPASPSPGTIVFVHGGGFVFGSPATHARFAALIAEGAGLPVVSVDYRLAPEHPFPAAQEDVISVLEHRADIGRAAEIEAGPCFLIGDSAGATLALSALLARADLARQITAAALCYGAFGTDFESPSYTAFDTGYGLTRQRMIEFWSFYLGGDNQCQGPNAVPLLADAARLATLPPLYINAAGLDPLLSDSLMLHQRLSDIGRSDALDLDEGVVHGYLQMSSELDLARHGINRLTRWVAEQMEGAPG